MISSRKKKCCQVTIFANSLGPEVLYNENFKGCFYTLHPWLKDLSWDDVHFGISLHHILEIFLLVTASNIYYFGIHAGFLV